MTGQGGAGFIQAMQAQGTKAENTRQENLYGMHIMLGGLYCPLAKSHSTWRKQKCQSTMSAQRQRRHHGLALVVFFETEEILPWGRLRGRRRFLRLATKLHNRYARGIEDDCAVTFHIYGCRGIQSLQDVHFRLHGTSHLTCYATL